MRLLGMIEALKTQEQDPTNRELSFPPSPLGALSIAISALAETATVIMYVANSKPLVEFPSRARPWPLHGGNADDRRMDEECMNVGKTVEESIQVSSAQDWATLGGQLGTSIPNCWAYSELSRGEPNFIVSPATMQPMGVPLRR